MQRPNFRHGIKRVYILILCYTNSVAAWLRVNQVRDTKHCSKTKKDCLLEHARTLTHTLTNMHASQHTEPTDINTRANCFLFTHTCVSDKLPTSEESCHSDPSCLRPMKARKDNGSKTRWINTSKGKMTELTSSYSYSRAPEFPCTQVVYYPLVVRRLNNSIFYTTVLGQLFAILPRPCPLSTTFISLSCIEMVSSITEHNC